MFPFMTSTELNLVARDHNEAVRGNGTEISIKYRQLQSPVPAPAPDEVYHLDPRPLNNTEVVKECVPCIIRIVTDRDLKILGFGIVEVGDAIFYFQDCIDFEEPVEDKPAVPGSVYFEDRYTGQWVPQLQEAGPLLRHMGMILGNDLMTQIVPCKLRK